METTVKQRLIQYLKLKKIGRNKFESKAGLSIGYISNIKSTPGTDKLVKILTAAPDLNKEWLMTGEGPMLLTVEAPREQLPAHSTRPRLPVIAAAGPISEYVGGIRADMCKQVPLVRSFPDYDFTILVKGDSMEPKFEGGDEIACKHVDRVIEWGREYLVSTNDGAFLKRLYPGTDDRTVRCVSYNPDYPDFIIDKLDILDLYRVVGLLRV